MRRGELRQLVEIQRQIPAGVNDFGEQAKADKTAPPDWAPLETVYAKIEAIAGMEFWHGQQVRAKVTHGFTMYYYPLTTAMRLVCQGRNFNVASSINPGERGLATEINVQAIEEVV